MTYNDDERRLLAAGKATTPELDASRDRLLFVIASSGAVTLAAASVKAAIALEAKLALGSVTQAGLAGLAKATIVGGAATLALGTSGEALGPVASNASTAGRADRITALPHAASQPTDREQTSPLRAMNSDYGSAATGTSPAAGARPQVAPHRTTAAHSPTPPQLPEQAADIALDPPARDGANQPSIPQPNAHQPNAHQPNAAQPSAAQPSTPRDDLGDAPPTAPAAMPSPPAAASASGALKALDAAKSALQRGDLAGVNRALAQYDRMRGNGALDPEAALLRLQALVAAGQGPAAAALARQWLQRHPHTPYADALRRIQRQTTGTTYE